MASSPALSDELQISGMRVIRMLMPWRERLDCGFGTTHGNADLRLIDVMMVLLAAFYNPTVRSQRCIEALSRQPRMREQTGVGRVPKSTLSDALRRFDPEHLRPLIEDLARRIPTLGRRDSDLERVTRQIIAADGSYFSLMGETAWALVNNTRNADGSLRRDQVRLNLQLDTRSFTPVDCDISGGDDASEAKAFIRRLKSDVIYVIDRNFMNFAFINAVLERGSNLVLRLKKSNRFDVESSRTLDAGDLACGVLSDEVGHLPGVRDPGRAADLRALSAAPTTRLLRRITIWDEKNKTQLVLLTDLLDLPARAVGVIYRQRWQVELFFKWLKCWANFDHLISHDPRGITLQFYVAVIATLLTHLATGRRVNKYSLLYLSWVAQGVMSWLVVGMQSGSTARG